ncbi:L-type lectin-domain containing receptor kinase IV.1-like [Tasmannia lanceolata]|uniref:L-type lectin-domain containing receptor kinase IV.1-like n=1 Tax=Tasmannia lanceolata TaxID=3420 RepID=UPI004064931B
MAPQWWECIFQIWFASEGKDDDFTYNGFLSSNLTRKGIAEITPDGLLRLTNDTQQEIGHAFYSIPLNWNNTSNGNVFSFSTTFVFAIHHEDPILSGHGIVFLIAPSEELPGALPSQYLGLFNTTNNGNSSNHVFGVELDTIENTEFGDINDNHVGIDINSLRSTLSSPAGYNSSEIGGFQNLSLKSGDAMQVWIEYDGVRKQLNVTLSPIDVPKPIIPLLSLPFDLSTVIKDPMYVGFSSSTGSILTSHYVLGWSFKLNGEANALNLSSLPPLPHIGLSVWKRRALRIGLPIISVLLLIMTIFSVITYRKKKKFAEILEDWELQYGPHRFFYKDLFIATKSFREKELLGVGGFGMVYRGVLPTSKVEVAVKRISHESKQGMREFIAEIASIGRIRHPKLVRLQGYCRRKGELVLVYDFMPNSSLNKFLFDEPKILLIWNQRFRIIKDVAEGVLFLHEGWVQVVLHRDIKASNVLLDNELNAKLGDFGLARLYDHGSDPETTHMVGTFGYLAPELSRIGKATASTDVFAFGAFMLEVACGRRPIEGKVPPEKVLLVDWVQECERRGAILEAADPKLGEDYVVEEMEMVLKLGLLCSQPLPENRPSMRQVVQFLEGQAPFPYRSDGIGANVIAVEQEEGSYPTTDSESPFSRGGGR